MFKMTKPEFQEHFSPQQLLVTNVFHVSSRWINMKRWKKIFFVSRTSAMKISMLPSCSMKIECNKFVIHQNEANFLCHIKMNILFLKF